MKAAIASMALMVVAASAYAQTGQTPPKTLESSLAKLKPEEQKKFEATTKASGINPADLKGMDLESAMKLVQSQRAKALETQLKDQIDVVQKRNESIAKLNHVQNVLKKALAGFKPGAPAGEKVNTTAYKDNDFQMEKDINSALEAAGIRPFKKIGADDTTASGRINTPAGPGVKNDAYYEGGIGGGSTKGQIEGVLAQIKSQIDALSNSQQMDMLRLQSLSNKRNEAFDTMTNFIKKMQDSRSSVIGNMR